MRVFQQYYRWLDLPAMLGVALVYALLAKIVLAFFSEAGNITLVWFPGGLGLTILLLRGIKYWPPIFAGALAAGLLVNDPIPVCLAIAFGNTLESVVAAWLLNRNPRFCIALARSRDCIWLTLTAMTAALISTAMGPIALWIAGIIPGGSVPTAMLRWWMSDAFGMITLTPTLLIWREWPKQWFAEKRVPEAVLLTALTLFAAQVVFNDAFQPLFGKLARGYWMFVFVIWAALRFGRHGALLITCLTTILALYGTAHHQVFFGDDFQKTDLLNLWFYILVLSWIGTILSITLHENRQITQDLTESERRLKAIIDASPVPQGVYDDQGNVTLLNPAFIATFGYTLNNMPTMSTWWSKAFPDPAYRNWVIENWQSLVNQARQHRPFETMEANIRCANGEVRTVQAGPVPLGESFVGSNLAILFDITERKNHERALAESVSLIKKSERHLKAIINASPIPYAVYNDQGRIILINPAFTETYGYALNDISDLSNWWLKAYPDARYREWVIETWQALVIRTEQNSAYESMEVNIRCKNGEVRTVQVGSVPLGESFLGSNLAILFDITERKRNEQTLAETVSLLQATLEATADGILVTDPQRHIRSFNQRFLDLWKIPPEQIEKDDTIELLKDLALNQLKEPDKNLDRINELYAETDLESYDLLEFKDDRQVERYSLPQRLGDEIIGRVWSFRDITERRQIEKQLLWRTAFLEALLEASPDGIITVDSEGHMIQQNRRAIQLWNIPAEITDHPDDAKQTEFIQSQTVNPQQFAERLQYLFTHPAETSQDEIELLNGTILERYSTSVWDWVGKYYGRICQYRDVTAERRAERALKQKEYYQRALLDNIPHAIWLKDRDGRFLAVNQEFAKIYDADMPDALVGKTDFDLVPPELAEEYLARDQRVLASREKLNVEEIITDRGEPKWFETYKAPVIDEQGQLLGTVGFARDITERKKAEENLRLAALVYENSSEAMLVTDADNNILSANPAFTAMTGYTADEVIGTNPKILRSGEHDEAFYQAMWHALNTTGTWHGEITNRRKNGEIYIEELTINTIFDRNGRPLRRVALFSDITQRKQSEEQIWRQANFDPLTGLPNRSMFRNRLEVEIKKAHRMGQSFALFFIDLDRFKEVNDALGHEMGDDLLKETAHRLQTCVRESDTVARLGGDEFTIILSELDHVDDCERIAENLLQKLSSPFRLGNEMAYVSASIGITLYPADSTDLGQLLKNADQAMYAAKNQGRNSYSFFTKALQRSLKERAELLGDLRNALPDHQFELYYQPVIELATGSIQKAEALLRWNHPSRGLIGPAEFISLAEETGLIIEIGEWVFRSAARRVAQWRTTIHPEFQISINKSPAQFHSTRHALSHWFDYLKELQLSGQSIVVEITEGLLLDANLTVLDHLLTFRDAGMQVAIDDFGTGYSALSYLKKFDIDYLKIDQSFIRNLSPDSSDFVLCEAIIIMAHKLGLKVIAEGVETEQQRDLLISVGCDYGQGYLFAEPMPAETFEKRFGRHDKE